MLRNWLTVIVPLFVSLQWVSEISALPQAPTSDTEDPPIYLYRGDSRPPKDIIRDGGFQLRQTGMNVEEGYSVVLHVKGVPPSGRSPDATVYVSTTDDPMVAAKFLRGEDGYIYRIRASKRMFSVEETLSKKLYDHPFPISNQREWVAMGGVSMEQIDAHIFVKGTASGKVDPNMKFDFDNPKNKNKLFDKSYETGRAGRGRPELAGFKYHPDPNHPGKLDDFYKKLDSEGTLMEKGRAFLKESVEPRLKWTGEGPLLPPPKPSKEPKKKLICTIMRRSVWITKRTPWRDLCDTDIIEPKSGNELQPGEKLPPGEKLKPGIPEVKPKPMDLAPVKLNPAKQAELAVVARRFSGEAFTDFALKAGFKAVIEGRWKMALPAVRAKYLGYKTLSGSSSKISPKGTALKVGSGALVAAGVGVWAFGVKEAFTTESSNWDKAAAFTAIIPFVGCGANLMAQAEKENANGVLIGVDTSLCLLGDALLLTPAWPLGVVVHLSRFLIQYFEPPPELPSLGEIKDMRDKTWRFFLDDHLTKAMSAKVWRDKLEAALTIESLGIYSQAADAIGVLQAGNQTMFNATDGQPQTDVIRAQDDLQKTIDKVRDGANIEVVRRQRRYLLNLPKKLREDVSGSLRNTAKKYNEDFTSKLLSDDMIRHYPRFAKIFAWATPDSFLYAPATERMEEAASSLREEKNLPQLPSLFALAYFVGVAAGVDDPPPRTIDPNNKNKPGFAKFKPAEPGEWTRAVNPAVINPIQYYKDKTGREDKRLVVSFARLVARHLLGRSFEANLPNNVPGLTGSDAQEFLLLLAMHMGNTFANWKEPRGSKVGFVHEDYQKEQDMPKLLGRLYNISPEEAKRLMS